MAELEFLTTSPVSQVYGQFAYLLDGCRRDCCPAVLMRNGIGIFKRNVESPVLTKVACAGKFPGKTMACSTC